MLKKKIAIIVLNWNGKEDTKKCLLSLQKLTYPHHEILLIDNGSTDRSCELLREEFPHIRLIETGINLGYAGGNNIGIRIALKEGFDFVFILNNDTIVDPGICEDFLEKFRQEDIGILGAAIYQMEDAQRLDHLGGRWNSQKIDFDYIGQNARDFDQKNFKLDYVCGAAIMIRREVFEKIGLFDPRFFLFWEEADFCARAKREGFGVESCLEAKVWHKISASFTGGKSHAAYFVWRNRLLWVEKNFTGKERFLFFARLLGRTFPKFLFWKYIRHLQLLWQKISKKKRSRNAERLVQINAALSGMEDYCLRRFWEGRSKNFMNCH